MPQTPDFEAFLKASPYLYLLLSRDLTIIGANQAYLDTTARSHGDIVGKHIFAAFPDDPADPAYSSVEIVRTSIERAVQTRKPDAIALLRYNIPRSDSAGSAFDERYWSVIHTPVLDQDGEVSFISQNAADITELYKTARTPGDTLALAPEDMWTRAQALLSMNRLLDAERTRLRQLFEQSPGFVAIMHGPQHIFELVNEAYCRLVGHRELLGKTAREVFPDVEGQGYFELLDQVVATGETFVGHEMRILLQHDPNGPVYENYIDLALQPIVTPEGTVTGIFTQGHDVTEQKRTRDALRISNERLKLAIEGVGDGVWDWDLETDESLYSERLKEILGYDDGEGPNQSKEWHNFVHPDDIARVREALQGCLKGLTPSYQAEYRVRCKDGRWKWVLSRGIVVARDANHRPLRMTGTITDVSEKRHSDELIWHHANFDSLTGLPNRRLFRDRLDQEVKKADRSGRAVGLLFIDLDRFKEVNDLLGHNVGDALLRQAAQRLCRCVRKSDTVARLGGDEFTVVAAEDNGLASVEQVARNILATLAEPFCFGNETAYLSASIGITLYPDDASDADELITNADQAMYAAKSAGRNQFRHFTRSMQERAHKRLRLGSDLRHALDAGEFEVVYQPLVDLTNGRILKAEALLRWHHPTLGDIDPAQFIPLAEESGMIHQIGDWVFKQAANCSRKWTARLGEPFQVSVNKSPVQFLSQSDESDWLRHLKHIGLPGSGISIEITEGLLLNASAGVAEKLLEYRDAGIQVAIDDFGTGYSSMAYLKKFDIDYLKIDQSFVRDMITDEGDRTIVRSIIAMAHELGLKVIAEGIETAAQKEFLATVGCDYGQGYLFARPTPPDKFTQLLDRSMAARR